MLDAQRIHDRDKRQPLCLIALDRQVETVEARLIERVAGGGDRHQFLLALRSGGVGAGSRQERCRKREGGQ